MKIIYLVLFALLFLSCSPEPVLRLEADDRGDNEKEIVMYQGSEFLYSQEQNSSVLLTYYRHIDGDIIFDIEVTNKTDEPIRFDPVENISWKAYQEEKEKKYINDSSEDWVLKGNLVKIGKGAPGDPEHSILEIDKEASRTNARNRSNEILYGVTGSMTALSNLVTINESEEERALRQKQSVNNAILRAERRDNYYQRVASLNEQRQYWEMESFRVTDIYAGSTAEGGIHLPITEDATHLTVIVTVGNEEHKFSYRQLSYSP